MIELRITVDNMPALLVDLQVLLDKGLAGIPPVPSAPFATPAIDGEISTTKAGRKRTPKPTTDQPVTDIGTDGEPVKPAAEAAAPEVEKPKPPTNPTSEQLEPARVIIRELMSRTDENTVFDTLQKIGCKGASDVIKTGKLDELKVLTTAAIKSFKKPEEKTDAFA